MRKLDPEFRETLVARPLALTLSWAEGKILEIELDWAKEGMKEDVRTEAGKALSLAFSRYVAGKEPAWPELPLDLDRLAPFQRNVLSELAKCGRGELLTYGALAARAGNPKAARAVGRAMATNPFPLVLPCHRVIGTSGKLTGFGGGLDMKRWLLELEGAL